MMKHTGALRCALRDSMTALLLQLHKKIVTKLVNTTLDKSCAKGENVHIYQQ